MQDSLPTVQGEIERVLARVADHPVRIHAAGRTDTGVHAWQQVFHFDSPAARDARSWRLGGNSQLPADISLKWVLPVAADFDARRSAESRHYRYVILNASARPGVMAHRVAWVIPPLDAARMDEAAQALVGEHDFSAFRDSNCQSTTPVRKLTEIRVRRWNEYVVMDVAANAFLHHMVRNIAGTLLPIGRAERPASWCAEVLAGRDRTMAGMTAAASGLYFVGPRYPARFGLPEAPPLPFPGAF